MLTRDLLTEVNLVIARQQALSHIARYRFTISVRLSVGIVSKRMNVSSNFVDSLIVLILTVVTKLQGDPHRCYAH